jgi:phosphate/sulfate permease
LIRHIAVVLLAVMAFAAGRADAQNCTAPELICKAAANQDRSLYFRDHCRYEQKIHIERYKVKGNKEATEELRDTTVTVEPAKKPDKSGETPVVVRVIADTDKKGNPKQSVKEGEPTLLSFGAVWDLAFFPLLPERVKNYSFQEVVADNKNERWFRFVPRADVTSVALASGIAQLDAQTGEVLTIKIEGLHNLESVDKEASKMKTFNATIDYNQFEGTLRMPTLAGGAGVSGIRRFEGNFKFKFEEGKYVPLFKLE